MPEGGQVRLVLDQGTEIASVLEHLPQLTLAVPTQPKFEDGFMVLLHETAAHAGMAKAHGH